MPQSGFTPVQLYRSTTAAAVPLAANLAAGELAINLTDEKLYFENASGVVKVLADSTYVGTVTSVAASGGTTGLSFTGSPITSSGTLTLSGTLVVANGGTGASTFTANGLLLGNGTSAVNVTAVGTTGQVLVGNTGAAPTWATLSSSAVTSFSAGTTGLTPSTSTTGAITLAGTLAVANGGTGVTTSTGTGSVVLSTSPVLTTPNLGTPSAVTLTSATGLPLSTGVTGTLPVANGGTGQTTYTNGQLLIGNTTGNTLTKATLTAGTNISITNGAGAITINATDQFVGTVTSVSGTGTVSGLTLTGTVTTSGSLTLGGTLAVTPSNFASQTANTFLAAPNGAPGAPTFRAIVAADVPTLNQNTTGTAANVTGIVAVANGGTGLSSTPANGAIDIGNGTGFTRATLTAGSGVSITNGAGSITIAATGSGGTVTSVNASGGTTGMTFSGGPITSSGTLTLAGTLAVANGGTGVTTSTGTGSVVLSASPSFTGTTNFGPAIVTGSGVSTGDAQFELGGNRTGDGPAYMDFHAVAGGDFNARVFRGSGANGNMEIVNAGTGVLSIATNATEKMRIEAGGNVGIGTASPGSKLDVAGDINASNYQILGSGASQAGTVGFLNSNGPSVQFWGSSSAQSGAMIINTAGSERMRITSAGNVGIGTTSPTERLDTGTGNTRTQALVVSGDQHLIFSASSTELAIRIGTGGPYYGIGTTGSSNMRINSSSGGDMLFAIGGTEHARITNAGNVGIGTSSPATRLHVAGTGSGPTLRLENQTATTGKTYEIISGDGGPLRFQDITAGAERMRIDSSGNVGIGTSSPLYQATVFGLGQETAALTDAGNKGGSLYLQATGITSGSGGAVLFGTTFGNATPFAAIKGLVTDGTSNTIGDLAISNRNAFTDTALTERMRITSAGNVGIGTTSPGAKLDVVGVSLTRTDSSGGSTPLIVRNDSTANNTTKSTGLLFQGVDTVGTGKNIGLVQCGPADANYATSYLAFFTRTADALSERFRIDSAGNVGIGTTTPLARLFSEVPSSVGAAIAYIANSNGAYPTGVFGGSFGYNFSAGGAEVDIWNGWTGASGTQGGFAFRRQTGASSQNLLLLVDGTGAVTSPNLSDAVGYKGVPQNAQTASYTLALSDMGKHISITTGGVVIPANGSVAFPIGSTIVVYNNSASAQNISITTDTLRLAGTATTGTRSLAQRGLATCVKVASTEWVVSGNVT